MHSQAPTKEPKLSVGWSLIDKENLIHWTTQSIVRNDSEDFITAVKF